MTTSTALKNQYRDLLKSYSQISVEQRQGALADLAKGLLEARASPLEIIKLHRDTSADIERSLAAEPGKAAAGQAEPLFHLLTAYSQALFEAHTRPRSAAPTPFHEVIVSNAYQRGPLAILNQPNPG